MAYTFLAGAKENTIRRTLKRLLCPNYPSQLLMRSRPDLFVVEVSLRIWQIPSSRSLPPGLELASRPLLPRSVRGFGVRIPRMTTDVAGSGKPRGAGER